jgi:hypothetical protein
MVGLREQLAPKVTPRPLQYAHRAVRSQPETEGRPMALGFTFRLELEDGTPADPATFRTAELTWKAGDTIPLGQERFAWLLSETTTQISLPR